MNIKQLSAIIDKRLVQLERQLGDLKDKQQANQDDPQLAKDITTLEQLKQKLLKSQDLAWRAHDLQRESDGRLLQRKRWIGLGLIAFCLFGLIGLGVIALLL